MKILLPAFVAIAGAFAISSACASDFSPPGELLTEEQNARAALDRGFDPDSSNADLILAEMAGARGDWIVSAQLAEKSYREHPEIWNEFNLATADSHIGRNDLAEPLYVNLVERGQFTDLEPIQNSDGSWPAEMRGTVAQEAGRRLDRMGYGGEGAVISDTVSPFPVLGGK